MGKDCSKEILEMVDRGYSAENPLSRTGTPASVTAERNFVSKKMGCEIVDASTLSLKGQEKWNKFAGDTEEERASFSHNVGILKFTGRPEQNPRYARLCERIRARWKENPLPAASVINFMPIPLHSDSTLAPLKYPGCIVPAAVGATRYAVKTFTEGFIEPCYSIPDLPDPFEWAPQHMAEEFIKLNPKGVRVVLGDLASFDENSELFKIASLEAIEWTIHEFLYRHPQDKSRNLLERRLKALGITV